MSTFSTRTTRRSAARRPPGALRGPQPILPRPSGARPRAASSSGRLSRLQAAGNVMTGAEQVLINDWFQQYPSHSIGGLVFGGDGALYVSAGDGASFNFIDYGQKGDPLNPGGDPPVPVGGVQTPPTAEGGALRAQDLRTSGDPVTLDGASLRLDPLTGAAMAGNPLGGNADPNTRRIIAYGLRNPFRMTARPGSRRSGRRRRPPTRGRKSIVFPRQATRSSRTSGGLATRGRQDKTATMRRT